MVPHIPQEDQRQVVQGVDNHFLVLHSLEQRLAGLEIDRREGMMLVELHMLGEEVLLLG